MVVFVRSRNVKKNIVSVSIVDLYVVMLVNVLTVRINIFLLIKLKMKDVTVKKV
jgi:hypothetical protein